MLIKIEKIDYRKYEKDFEVIREEMRKRIVKIFGVPIFTMTYKYDNENISNTTQVGFKRGDK